jgi:threonyl-tRNA synthetase
MVMITITLKDGTKKEVEAGISVLELAKNISEGLARVATVAEVNGEIRDLRFKIQEDASVNILTFDSDLNGKKAYWHTTSHIMAQAVKRLFPEVKLAIGPAIDDGFYYDFDVETPFTDEDKTRIEEEMKKIIKEDLKIEKFSMPREEAIRFMKGQNEPYKVELIEDLPEGEEISFYQQGEFTDLCAGPHVMLSLIHI